MSNVVYSVKCPKCSAKATAQMHRTGEAQTYMIKMGARLIVCAACGFFWEVPLGKADSYELWYASNFKGHRLWATNGRHLAFLISWLEGDRSKANLHWADREYVGTLPKWIVLAKNRAAILRRLRKMADEGANKPKRRTQQRLLAKRRT